jgi:hypothetical protein
MSAHAKRLLIEAAAHVELGVMMGIAFATGIHLCRFLCRR